MVVVAYVIVLVVSQFVFTAGVIGVGLIGGMVFALVPERLRMPFLGFLGGVAGAVLTVFAAELLFGWIAGPESIGWGSFAAAVVPLAIPIVNDWSKYRKLRLIENDAPPRVAEFGASSSSALGTTPIGAIVGILLGAILFT
ncbi:MAG: hypothetical protein WEG36_05880 [Gemmatimonadota bacterium]